MDLGRATRLVSAVIKADHGYQVSHWITVLRQRMDQLVSTPNTPEAQLPVAEAIEKLRAALASAMFEFSAEELADIEELTRIQPFDEEIVIEIEDALAHNPATPAVARDAVTTMENARVGVFTLLQSLASVAGDLRWNQEELKEWDAEVGFKIPRDLFSNEFDKLIGEFRFLRRFLSDICEVEGESLADVQLASLSTTDPLIVLGVVVVVAERIGKLTTWALASWKTFEEIRKIREETRKLKSFSEEEVEKIFGDKIRTEVDAVIREKATELAANVPEPARRNELESALGLHLKEFIGRIERGMTVEVKLLVNPTGQDGAESEETTENGGGYTSLRFPPPSPNPVLMITQQGGV